MIVSHIRSVEGIEINDDQVKNIVKKVLVSPEDGWEGYVMRLFELGKNGHTPKHTHPWPHINFVVEGEGVLRLDGKHHILEEGSFAFVPGGKEHQFSNKGDNTFKIICIVPEEGEK